MKRILALAGMALFGFLALAKFAPSKDFRADQPKGHIVVPASSIEHPGDAGVRMHTNFVIFVPNAPQDANIPPPTAETPASLACVYRDAPLVPGCPINGTTQNPSGGWGAIGIVDAYDNPDAEMDLAVYSSQFGLPSCTKANGCFSQIYQNNEQPQNQPGGWSLEEALDIEMAHAMAPGAKIMLFEAQTNNKFALYLTEQLAAQTVAAAGGGSISNSWATPEYSGESDDDFYFQQNGIVFFASSGDNAKGVSYPAASVNVVAVGGTFIDRPDGLATAEDCWAFSGGGPSQYEPRPSYQDVVENVVGSARGNPDISFDAAGSSGPAMYDADGGYGWFQVGGTSVSSPAVAGIVNASAHKAKSSSAELNAIYNRIYADARNYKANYRDITRGSNGYVCTTGYDFVTGIGSLLGHQGN
jgi:kumamolisin